MKNRIRVGAIALACVALGALAAACGGSSTPTTPASNAQGNNAFAAYTACLQRNGVTLPSRGPRPSESPRPRPSGSRGPGFGGGGFGGGGFGGGGLFGTQAPAGVDQATWDKATKACASVRPTAGPSGGPGNNSAFAAYRNCLTDHGVNLTAGGFNTADPAFVAADKACAPLRPTGRPRPSTTPTP